MTWQDQLKGDSLTWLLEPDNPGVRYLALRDLLDRPEDDAELRAAQQAAHTQGPIADVLAAMHPEGHWVEPGAGLQPEVSLHRMVDHSAGATGRISGARRTHQSGVRLPCWIMRSRPGGQFTHFRRRHPARSIACRATCAGR